ncbi:MAG: hypothetical protein EPO40_16575 [Myxococcaceae bacterium]|nr:MAG: hypothetical protein EPO40_16575 [Myxococcaceae bacterium]
MSDDASNVLPMIRPARDDRGPHLRRVARKPYCSHPRYAVDVVAREVFCEDCDTELDPIKVMETLALEVERWRYMVTEQGRLTAEVEALKVEVTKLRAARNDLRRKASAP